MQIDIPSHIEKLLFLHDALSIPGFGSFAATRTAASADYVGGVVNPPAKALTFSENLTTDDGILINDIAQTQGIPVEDARQALVEFVEKMQDLLNQREIVTLPGVGRLYKNYVQKIQFLPDATNFNSESFGLPPLQFSPIARSREVVDKPVAATPTPATEQAPTPPVPTEIPEKPRPTVSPALIALGIALLIIGILAGIWWLRGRHKPVVTPQDNQTEVVQKEKPVQEKPEKAKMNMAPATPPPAEKPIEKPEVKKPATIEHAAQEPLAKKKPEVRKEPKSDNSTGAHTCILIVATLHEKSNADRLVKTLDNAGYSVYQVQKSGYQVGIQFRYQNLSEVQQKIIALQKLTGEQQIWIKQK